MEADRMAGVINYLIMAGVGVWTTLKGFRAYGPPPGESPDEDRFHDRYGRSFKIGGPILIVGGLAMALMKWMRYW